LGPATEDDRTANDPDSDGNVDQLCVVEDERSAELPIAGLGCTDKDWGFSHDSVYDGFGSDGLEMMHQKY
jgi:hypothetical protein